jgi:hypothetical protein
MVDKQEIRRLLKQYFRTTGKITISDEGLIFCKGNVELKTVIKHERLPVAFDRVDGSFVCDWNELETLEGAPKRVGKNFSCFGNQLTTLKGAPQSVPGEFLCGSNKLTDLEGAPQSVGSHFGCSNNEFTTLQGAPNSVGGDFYCVYNKKLTTLEGLPAIQGTLKLSYSPTLPLLRCLLAKKVEFVPELNNTTIETILNKYTGKGKRAMFDCQKELEDAGFEENARW